MNALIFLSGLILSIYIIWAVVKEREIPHSISATYYLLERPIFFSLTLCVSALMLLPAMLSASSPNTEFLAFISVGGLLLVGAAPQLRLKTESRIHDASAIFAVLASQIWVFTINPRLIELWGIYVMTYLGYLTVAEEPDFKKRLVNFNPIFWAEITALIIIFASLIAS